MAEAQTRYAHSGSYDFDRGSCLFGMQFVIPGFVPFTVYRPRGFRLKPRWLKPKTSKAQLKGRLRMLARPPLIELALVRPGGSQPHHHQPSSS